MPGELKTSKKGLIKIQSKMICVFVGVIYNIYNKLHLNTIHLNTIKTSSVD